MGICEYNTRVDINNQTTQQNIVTATKVSLKKKKKKTLRRFVHKKGTKVVSGMGKELNCK